MLPTTLQERRRKETQAEDPIDPYELVRRLSAIQAEEALKELERKRNEWEAQLLESRGIRQGPVRARGQSTPSEQSYRQHKRSASISLAPNQLPPLAYTDLPEPARKQSLPFISRPPYVASPRRPSLKRGDSGDLETINENAVVEPTLENLFPEWTEKQRKRPSALPRVDEDCGPEVMSTQWKARRPSSSSPPGQNRQHVCLQSDDQSTSSRRSSSATQAEHRRQDWSQSDESTRTGSRRSSLLEKVAQHWKQGRADTSDIEAFDSKGSTLRSSWRSSTGGSTSSRGPSIRRKIQEDWVGSPPSSDEQFSVQDVPTEEDDSAVSSPIVKRKSGLFSKLRH